MARLTLEQVRQVAELAALELEPTEAQEMCHDLGAILDHMAALERVDVSGVPPTVHPIPLGPGLRADQVRPSGLCEELLAAAPESEQGGFAVPKVLEGDK